MNRLIYFFLLLSFCCSAQPPVIKYPPVQIYFLNRTQVNLFPENSGGAVPAVTHNQVSTFAGNGSSGGDDGQGTSAKFHYPAGLYFAKDGYLYVADSFTSTIRKINQQGNVTTLAGGGMQAFANGNGRNAYFSAPFGISEDASGNLYVADLNNNQIRKIEPNAEVSTFAGNANLGSIDGTATQASFANPAGIAANGTGDFYVTDNLSGYVRKINSSGEVSTLNGTTELFNGPCGLTLDRDGNIYIADVNSHTIKKIDPLLRISVVAGSGNPGSADGPGLSSSFKNPFSVTSDQYHNLYVADFGNHLIRKIGEDGEVTTVAGTGTIGDADGDVSIASFNYPSGIVIDNSENIFVSDYFNNKIRKITLGGYTIDKALPSGLIFDPKTGIISGMPTELWPATAYTIQAYNLAGSSVCKITISVTEPPVIITKIPNVFSPNGDGINDVWNISGLIEESSARVIVFNRLGVVVFEAKSGYHTPWDGKYQQKDLPEGVYYYLITNTEGAKFSGYVNILR